VAINNIINIEIVAMETQRFVLGVVELHKSLSKM
jgi:hypothetical protein